MNQRDSSPHTEPARFCSQCGSELVTGTVDLADTPDVTQDVDQEKAMLNPGQMVETVICPNPDCPVREVDTGAEL